MKIKLSSAVTATLLLLASLNGCLSALAEPDYSQIKAIPLPEPRVETPLDAETQGEIWFDSHSPFDFDILLNHLDRSPTTSTLGYLFLPAKASPKTPAPAMVLLPGSGGVKLGRQMLMADLLVSNGYAVLIVDYYASRKVDDDTVPYRLMVTNVTEFDVVSDGYAALRALHQHPAIDAERIGVMGFSYGGMATRLAMDSRLKQRLAPRQNAFAVHVDFYGPCFQDFGTVETSGAPLLTLRGAMDASNDLAACTLQEEQLRKAGSEVSATVYPRAGHSWESLWPRQTVDNTYIRGCQMIYDKAGLPSVHGTAMIQPGTALDRQTRYQLRMNSGRFFEGCLHRGYIIGRDQTVYEDANKRLLQFLRKNL